MLIIFFFGLGSCLVIFTLSFPTFFSVIPVLSIHPYIATSILIVCGLLYGFCTPIFYEFGVEITYPLSPIISSGFFTFWINIFTLIFLVSNIDNSYINSITAFSMVVCAVPLFFVTESYKRSDIDTQTSYLPSTN